MQQLAEENRPLVVRGITYDMLHPTRRTALFVKGILEFLRIQKQVLVFLLVTVLVGWLAVRTELFAALPLLEVKEFRLAAGALCIVTALDGLYQLLEKQVKTVCDKRLLGLSLPVSTGFILVSYALAAALLNLAVAVSLSLLFMRPGMKTVLFWLLLDAVYLRHSVTAVRTLKLQRLFITASTVLLLLGTYYCLIL